MSAKMTLLIMAAGSGSRYGKLKQFDAFGLHGEFLMEYSIYDAIRCGFQHIVIVTKEEYISFLKNHFSLKLPSDVSLTIIPQLLHDIPIVSTVWKLRKKPWGTAHAIWTARNSIDNPFVVINADDFYGKDAFKKAALFLEEFPQETMLGLVSYPLLNTLSKNGSVSRGICKVAGNDLLSIQEVLRIVEEHNEIIDSATQETYTGNELVSMNFWICKSSIFKEIEFEFCQFLNQENALKQELFIPSIIQKLIKEKKATVRNMTSLSKWFGITYKEDRDIARAHIQLLSDQHEYPNPLW